LIFLFCRNGKVLVEHVTDVGVLSILILLFVLLPFTHLTSTIISLSQIHKRFLILDVNFILNWIHSIYFLKLWIFEYRYWSWLFQVIEKLILIGLNGLIIINWSSHFHMLIKRKLRRQRYILMIKLYLLPHRRTQPRTLVIEWLLILLAYRWVVRALIYIEVLLFLYQNVVKRRLFLIYKLHWLNRIIIIVINQSIGCVVQITHVCRQPFIKLWFVKHLFIGS